MQRGDGKSSHCKEAFRGIQQVGPWITCFQTALVAGSWYDIMCGSLTFAQ